MKINALNKVNKTLYLCKIDNFEYEASSIKIMKRIKTNRAKTNIIIQYIFLFKFHFIQHAIQGDKMYVKFIFNKNSFVPFRKI